MWKPGKFVTILLWVLAMISVVLCVYVFVRCSGLSDKVPEEREIMMGVINPMFIWIYVLVILTTLIALVMPLPQLIKHPKSLLRMVFGLIGFGVVILLAYGLSSGDALPFPPNHDAVTEGTLRFADVNLYSIYIMFALSIITVLFSSLFVNIVKRK